MVEELIQLLSKGLRATQLYLPNNPVYQKAIDNVRGALRKVFEATDDLALDVSEVELRWEGHVVYKQDQHAESIAWMLFKDGVRSVTMRRGVEQDELVRLLQALQKARNLQADAADDLLTLLWQEDFQYITYTFREPGGEGEAPIEKEAQPQALETQVVVREVKAEVPERPPGMVSMDDFDTTLYFLDDKEIRYLQGEIEREYAQDLRRNVLSMLFDLLELQTFSTVRQELISILENFIPYLLGASDFRSVAFILRETRAVLQRARELIPEQRLSLEGLPSRLSQPEALGQLLQSLDEAAVHPTEEELGELFTELRADALVTLMGWLPRLTSERVRLLVHGAAERLAQANPGEVLRALASEEAEARLEMVKLAARLKLPGAPEGMGKLLETGDRALRLAVVDALTAIGSPTAVRLLERAVEDNERDVRIAAVKFLGSKGQRSAFPRIEGAITAGKLKDADETERRAFFEAYGMLSGAAGVALLEKLLVGKGGLLGRKEDALTRACAAMALGKIKAPEARRVLERAADDKDALVRNAVTRALREVGA